ncbi:MAG: hypothetical protein ACQEXV_06970 [Bacillota bacterium]
MKFWLIMMAVQQERVKALQEAARVLKKGGTLITSAISRLGSLLWGLSVYGEHNTIVEEDAFMDMVRQELTDGQHVRPVIYPSFIARSYFHIPDAMRAYWQTAGLPEPCVFGVEGPGWTSTRL